jgi:hypothetical protein
MKRKDFIKRACFSGTCLCGFGSLLLAGEGSADPGRSEEGNNDRQDLIQEWVANLLTNMNKGLDEESIRKVMKKCAVVHYNNLRMDDILTGYTGNLEAFMKFLEEKWGWKIQWDAAAKTLIADENKDYCVCPMVNREKDMKSAALCYCSEGFAEMMFGRVTGGPATATVISSIQRGDKSCKYKVTFS